MSRLLPHRASCSQHAHFAPYKPAPFKCAALRHTSGWLKAPCACCATKSTPKSSASTASKLVKQHADGGRKRLSRGDAGLQSRSGGRGCRNQGRRKMSQQQQQQQKQLDHASRRSSLQAQEAGGVIHCEHFDACSGCSLSTGILRPAQYAQAAEFFQGYLGLLHFPLISGPTTGWRCRAKLAVRGSPGSPLIGLFKEGSHEVTPIPNCPIHHPRINQAVDVIKQLARAHGIAPYNESTGSGQLRYIQLTAVSSDLAQQFLPAEADPNALIQVVLVWRAGSSEDPEARAACQFAAALWEAAGHGDNEQHRPGLSSLLHSVVVNYKLDASNSIFGTSWQHVAGPEVMWQRWQGTPVCIGPGSFVQANYGAFQTALASIADAIPSTAKHIVELHAGAGAIGLSLLGRSAALSSPCTPSDQHRAGGNSAQDVSHQGPTNEFPCIELLRCVEANPHGQPLFQASLARLLSEWPQHSSQSSAQTHASAQTHSTPTPSASIIDTDVGQQERRPEQSSFNHPQQHPQLECHSSSPAHPFPHHEEHQPQSRSTSEYLQPQESVPSQLPHISCTQQQCPPPLHTEYLVAAAGSQPDAFLKGADVVIVDPPRKGLEPSLLHALAQCRWPRADRGRENASTQQEVPPGEQATAMPMSASRAHTQGTHPPRRLIYLSCGFPALVRDTRVLLGLQPAPAAAQHSAKPSPVSESPVSLYAQQQQQHKGAVSDSETGGLVREGEAAAGGTFQVSNLTSKSSRRRLRRKRLAESKASKVRDAVSAEHGSADSMRAVDPSMGGLSSAAAQEHGERRGGGAVMGGAARWRLIDAKAVLFFPGTDAIETLAVFEEVCGEK